LEECCECSNAGLGEEKYFGDCGFTKIKETGGMEVGLHSLSIEQMRHLKGTKLGW